MFANESVLTVNLKLTPSLRSERHKAKRGNIFFKKLNKSLILFNVDREMCLTLKVADSWIFIVVQSPVDIFI